MAPSSRQTARIVADVAIADGRIERIGPDLDADGVESIDASGDAGPARASSTSTRTFDCRTPSIRIDSARTPLAAAAGGTTTVLTFNNPGTGISDDGARSLLRGLDEFRARTAGESAVDFGLCAVISGQQDDPVAELPALIDAGVPTFKAFMVYDFRLADADLDRALRTAAQHGGMLAGALRGPGDHRSARGRCVAPWRDRLPVPRPDATLACRGGGDAEGHRDGSTARTRRSTSCTCRARRRSRRSRRRRRAASRSIAETCPHYLTFTDALYADPDEAEVIKRVISPPLRTAADVDELWAGLRDGILDVVGSDHVPDRLDTEKAVPAPPFPEISNGGPGVETLLGIVFSEGVATGGSPSSAWPRCWPETPARLLRARIEGGACAGPGCRPRRVGSECATRASAGGPASHE